MDITIYLPDDLGRWAKDNGLKLSAMLREAVAREREHREWMERMGGRSAVHEIRVEHDDDVVDVRLHATKIAESKRGNEILYLTNDGRALVEDMDAERLYGFDQDETDPFITYVDDAGMEHWRHRDPAFYRVIMRALGENPIIEIGANRGER